MLMPVQLEAETLTGSYVNTLQHLYEHGDGDITSQSSNPTAQDSMLEATGVTNIIKRPRTRKIVEPILDHPIGYTANEFAWYLSGDYNVKNKGRMEKIWEPYADKQGNVNSNYGAKIWHEPVDNHRTQWDVVKQLFKNNIHTRRAIININLFNKDYKQLPNTKDFPCNVVTQFLVRNQKLHLHIYQRSCDIVHGYTHDVPFFTLVQEMLLREIQQHTPEVTLGHVVHHAGSMHLYDDNKEKLEGRNFNHWDVDDEIVFPEITHEDVRQLLNLNFNADTHFINNLREELDDYWTNPTNKVEVLYRDRLSYVEEWDKYVCDDCGQYANNAEELVPHECDNDN